MLRKSFSRMSRWHCNSIYAVSMGRYMIYTSAGNVGGIQAAAAGIHLPGKPPRSLE